MVYRITKIVNKTSKSTVAGKCNEKFKTKIYYADNFGRKIVQRAEKESKGGRQKDREWLELLISVGVDRALD